MQHRLALSHAGGIVAEAILDKLAMAGFAPDSLILLDDESGAGNRLPFGGGHLRVRDQQTFDFSECSALLMPEADTDLEAAAVEQGCLLVSHAIETDTAPLFAAAGGEPDIAYSETRVRLAGPELSCLLPALLELERHSPLTRINATLVRSAEFRGKAGVDELAMQTIGLLNAREVEARVYPQQIAFNLLPGPAGSQMASDLRRIMGNSSFTPLLQLLTAPIFHGFAAALQLGFADDVAAEDCSAWLAGLETVTLKSGVASPVVDCNRSFSCAISHLEQTPSQPRSLQFWLLADPMRYGLANNYVNVADFLLKSFL